MYPKRALKINNDGFFKIVQFTDTEYLDDDHGLNVKTGKMMQDVIRVERPDLIVFTCDVIGSLRCINPEQSFREVVSVAEQAEQSLSGAGDFILKLINHENQNRCSTLFYG